ncbi:MAG TPA: hypothetical protein VFE14_10955 [Micromonosporaceae bacterium]|jgi:hypothetical protein|nr:hypothetical protein [Micromonosporaceae bacterium]
MTATRQENALREAMRDATEELHLAVTREGIAHRARRSTLRRMAATCAVVAALAIGLPVVLASRDSAPPTTSVTTLPTVVNPTRDNPLRTGAVLKDGRELVIWYGNALTLGGRDRATGVVTPDVEMSVAHGDGDPSLGPHVFEGDAFQVAGQGGTITVRGFRGKVARITATVSGRTVDVPLVWTSEYGGGLCWVVGPGDEELRPYDASGKRMDR